ncbi:MAG: hypothetical protein Q8O89_00205 [Nanoarchaeota archaeon]|nr:hypothetical protein [Nanoarchaeota archaeon]
MNKKRKSVHSTVSLRKNTMKKCYECSGKLVLTKDLIVKDGRSYPVEVELCNRCGKTFYTLEEAERVKKELYPSLSSRIKRLFSSQKNVELSVMRGKVL